MIHRSSSRIGVAVRHCEPLLAIGVRAALQEIDTVQLMSSVDLHAKSPTHVLITDWGNGLEVMEKQALDPAKRVKVLVISSQVRDQALRSALRRGMHGLLLSGCSTGELVCAISALAQGRSYICAEVAQRMAASLCLQPLTAREDEVLALMSRGQCNKAIASGLGIATGTVKSHVKAILGKLAARSRTEAASIAAELGMVEVAHGASAPRDVFTARRASKHAAELTPI